LKFEEALIRFDKKCKRKPGGFRAVPQAIEVDSVVEVIQALISMGLMHVQEELQLAEHKFTEIRIQR
jgi:hypothetical protein